MTPRTGEIKGLTGLRAIAALLIVALHTYEGVQITGHEQFINLLKPFLGLWFGVDLFFVLSGFFITRQLLGLICSEAYLQRFYVLRILRIFPIYYLLIALALCTVPLAINDPRHPWYVSLFSASFFLANFQCAFLSSSMSIGLVSLQHFWSLSLEEHFYCVWPHIIKFSVRREMTINLLTSVIVLEPAVRLASIMLGVKPDWLYLLTPFRLDSICVGAFVAVSLGQQSINLKSKGVAYSVLITSTAAFVLLAHGTHFARNHILTSTIGYSITAIFFGSLVASVVCSSENSLLAKILGAPLLNYFGKRSYAIYLYHLPITLICNRTLLVSNLQLSFLNVFLCGIVIPFFLTLGLAMLTFAAIENPIANHKPMILKWLLARGR